MNNKKLNAAILWKQFEDVLVPALRLSVIERSVYSHLIRHTLLEGKPRLRFSINWLARASFLTATTARRAVRRLVAKGVIRLVERTRDGHLIEVLHPDLLRPALPARENSEESPDSTPDATPIRTLRGKTVPPSAPDGPHPRRLQQSLDFEDLDFLSTKPLRQAIHARGRGLCFYCLRRLKPRARCLDHVVPQFRSGGNSYRNLVSCCLECNSGKRDKPAADFLRQLYREHRLTAAEFASRLRALDDLAAGKLRPALPALGGPCLRRP